MRILHVAETVKGGVATIVRQLVIDQDARGMSPECLVPAEHIDALDVPKKTRICSFNRNRRSLLSLVRLIICLIRSFSRSTPDVIHFHSTFAGLIGRPLAFFFFPLKRPTIIYSPHAWAFIMEGSHLRRKTFASIERALLIITDRVICVSNYELSEAKKWRLSTDKMTVIHNGVEPPLSGSFPDFFPDGKIKLLFVGRFDYQKGFDLVVEVANKLDPSKFHLFAVGDAVNGKELTDRSDLITYTGWLNRRQMAMYYANADVLIMPSRWEGFGLVAAEAQSYGLPVLASNCTSLPELIVDGKTGYLVDPSSPDELLVKVEQTPLSKWQSMRSFAKENYVRNFTARRMCEQTASLYLGHIGRVRPITVVEASAPAPSGANIGEFERSLALMRAIAEQINRIALEAAIDSATDIDADDGISEDVRALSQIVQLTTQRMEQRMVDGENITTMQSRLSAVVLGSEVLYEITVLIGRITAHQQGIAIEKAQPEAFGAAKSNVIDIQQFSQRSAGRGQTAEATRELQRLADELNDIATRATS